MSHVFARHSRASLPTVARGEGCYIFDQDGKKYFDGSCGAAVSCLGHSDQDVTNAIKDQMDQIAFGYSGFFTSDPAEELADLLIAGAPEGIDRVYYVSGGSEAVESALKLARQYFCEIGLESKHRVISRRQSYHGNTLGALASGGNFQRRAMFEPLLAKTSHISPCYKYRGKKSGESHFDYGQRVANELETEILTLGADQVMAFIAEPIVGATLGAVSAEEGYFKRIREICDRYNVLLIFDEIMCGMGRTGSLYACEQEHVSPDIITIAKGLGAGYQPIGAMLCSRKIHDTIRDGTGFFQHGHTYLAHTTACAAAKAVQLKIKQHKLVDHVDKVGNTLLEALEVEFGQHAHVGDIRGRGLFIGIELVEDRETKSAFDPALRLHERVKHNAFEAGLICYPMGGTIDGKRGDHILLAPPFIMEFEQIDEIVSKLSGAITKSLVR